MCFPSAVQRNRAGAVKRHAVWDTLFQHILFQGNPHRRQRIQGVKKRIAVIPVFPPFEFLQGKLIILVERGIGKRQPRTSRTLRGDELMEYLQRSPGRNLNVKMAAERLGMSLSGLRLFCQQQFCKPPSTLIQEVKMLRARALLSYGDLSIDSIAEELGYADRFSFSKAFLKFNEVTPGEYRRRYCKNRRA